MPQLFVDVDRDKVLKQGVDITDVYKILQSFMGSGFINYFNKFGRQWQMFIQAEGDYRTNIENIGQFYVRNKDGQSVPLSALTSIRNITGPEFTHALQPLPLGPDQRHRGRRVSARPRP